MFCFFLLFFCVAFATPRGPVCVFVFVPSPSVARRHVLVSRQCLCVLRPPRPPRRAAAARLDAHSLSCCRPPRGGRRAASMAAATKAAAEGRVRADAEAQGARDAHGQSARPRARRRRRAGRRPARRPRARPGRRRRGPRPPRGRPRAGRLAGPRRLASYALMYSILSHDVVCRFVVLHWQTSGGVSVLQGGRANDAEPKEYAPLGVRRLR